jgi:hypothetical protein
MTLDNPTAAPGAASELLAAPLDGIELAAPGGAEHLPAASAEASPSGAVSTSALSPPPALAEAPEAAPVLEPSGERSAQKRGRPFEPGQSGNPTGRPKGLRTQALEALIEGQGEALGAKAVEKALDGDSTMLRALLSTLVAPRRERTVEFELPKIESAPDARKASSAVISACAAGELSPHEATEIMGLISTHVRTIEVAELEVRLTAVEKREEP